MPLVRPPDLLIGIIAMRLKHRASCSSLERYSIIPCKTLMDNKTAPMMSLLRAKESIS